MMMNWKNHLDFLDVNRLALVVAGVIFQIRKVVKKMESESIIAIVDLIEDSEFPARRNISDYISSLLKELNVEDRLIRDVESTFDDEYEKRGEQKCFSQSQWLSRISNMYLCKDCRKANKGILDMLELF